ncbi:MAG: VCBS repeat-containing protein [Acidobacteria bacterium]|nr:VCBS repeat-containing protein [Acidobacteriota bacterium]
MKKTIYNRSLILFVIVLGLIGQAGAAVRQQLVSAAPTGAAGNAQSRSSSISADGRYVAFYSTATDLVGGLTVIGGTANVYVRDTLTGTTRCLSVTGAGSVTGNQSSFDPLITPNGRYVLFISLATNLVANDTNGKDDIFRYDLLTNQIELVSVNAAGTASGNNDSGDIPSSSQSRRFDTSDDGRFVAFPSTASDLTTISDTNGATDIFVRDMVTHTTQLVSVNVDQNAAGNDFSADVTISADGNVVSFYSAAQSNQLAAGTSDFGSIANPTGDVFVRDLRTQITRCASLGRTVYRQTANATSFSPTLSKDGTRVAFISYAGDLALPDTNAQPDVFVYDVGLATTSLVSINEFNTNSGNAASPFGGSPEYQRISISDDGRYVTFESRATDLAVGVSDTFASTDVFRRDLAAGVTEPVTVDASGLFTGTGVSANGEKGFGMSRDGRFVVFVSTANNLTGDGFPLLGAASVFVRDMLTGITTAMTLNNAGNGYGDSGAAKISANGRSVIFESNAANLTATDTNGQTDVFLSRVSAPQRAVTDFDGDGLSDFAVFRPQTNGVWYVLNNPATNASYRYYGAGTDLLAPADYNGDGRTDYAVFRPSNGTWYISDALTFAETTVNFGQSGDKPLPEDFDGDGRADLVVFRSGSWWWQSSRTGQATNYPFGLAGDVPVAGDFDGDGRADYAVFRPSNGTWYVRKSSDGQYIIQPFGLASDKPVAMDYDGDGKTDIAVFRGGIWYVLRSTDGGVAITQFGLASDIPSPGSYDADGRADIAVFRPSEGNWYVLRSTTGAASSVHFGQTGDLSVAAAFIP